MLTFIGRFDRASGETPAQAAARNPAPTGYIQALHLANLNINASINNETLNACQTKSIMSDAAVKQALLEVIDNNHNFNALSNHVLWRESTYMPLLWPDRNEREIAGSLACFHNAGRRQLSPSSAYVTSLQHHWKYAGRATAGVQHSLLHAGPKTNPLMPCIDR